ncbi:MAG: ABC transporter permease [Alphaproteobacteria bacterium]|nr:ABC transporter permease [Alphaproteobacteria bacterium]
MARPGGLERRQALWIAFYAAPAALLMLGVFAVPLGTVFVQSLTTEASSDFTLASYGKILSATLFARVSWKTLEITLLATGFALLLAYPLAYYMAQQPPRRRAMLMILVLVPFWTSVLVKSFAFTVILGQSGLVNTALGWLGIPPVKLLFNRIGVIVGMSHFLVPFMVFPILSNLLNQPRELTLAASILGAGKWRIFWRVTLPLSMSGVMAGVLLVMILSLGFYVVPALLGGRQDMMLANLVDFYARETIDWPMASALSVLLMGAAAVAALLLSLIPGGSALLGGDEP